MKQIRRRSFRYALHCGVFALASPALAQSVEVPRPPSRTSVDERGVDLVSGSVSISDPEISIGTPENGLQHTRYWPGLTGWRHGYMISAYRTPTELNLSIAGESVKFTVSGSSYVPQIQDGSTVSEDENYYIFTDRDGTVIKFDKNLYAYNPNYGGTVSAFATSVTRTDGFKTTLYYKTGFYYPAFSESDPVTMTRLSSVRTSTGFQLKYTYNADDLDESSAGYWAQIGNVRAINAAVDYCDPAADTCSGFTQSWPTVSYAYSVSGSDVVEAVTDPTSRVRRYVRNGAGRLTGIRQPSSPGANNITYGYDGNGRVSSVAVAGVGTWGYTFTSGLGTMTAVVSTPTISYPKTVVSNTTYQQPTSITNENGYTTLYSYDGGGRLQTVTKPEGNYITYNYDARGNVTSAVATPKSGSGLGTVTTSATYPGSCGNPATCNKPTSTTDAAGNATNYYYNSNGQLNYVQQPAPSLGAPRPETHYTYWTGQAWLKWSSNSVTLAPEAITMLANTTTCVTGSWPCASANQRITDVGYIGGPSPTNMLINGYTTRAGDNSVSSSIGIGYDAFGNVTSTTDALGKTTTMGYYADRQLDYVSSPSVDGTSTGYKRGVVWHYDGNGQVDSQTWATTNWDGSGYTPLLYRWPEYDGAGRQVAEREGTSTGSIYALKQWSYNGAGRLDCETLRMNPADFGSRPAACMQGTGGQDRITHYVWESAGLLDRTQSGWGTALQRDDAHYDRNLNGQLIAMTDAKGNVTSYARDGHDRQLRECYNASAAACQAGSATDFVQFTYDSAGRLTNKGLRGHSVAITIGYVYDGLGRLTNANYPGGSLYDSPVTYTYDNLGQLLSATDTNTHSATFGYDALGRVISQGDARSSRTMQYDAAGRRTRLTWPDGRYVTYQYNAVGEMTGILESGSSSLAAFTYDGLGNRTSLTRGNGVVTTYAYDAAARLSCLKHDLAGGGTLGCPPGTFTASGQDQVTAFDYNVAGQITARTAANDAYAWDAHYNFNRNYTTNGLNQYTAVGAVTPTYDIKGNLSSAGGSASYYTSTKNELITRNDLGYGFYYDPLKRIDSVMGVPGGGYGFEYTDGQITDEFAATTGNPTLRRYVYGPNVDEPLVWYEGSDFSNKRYLVADERGSIVAVTNPSGTAIAINSYDEYGIPGTANQGRFQYTGQAWLSELGMYSFKARIYSPTFGRFLQTDPAGYPDGPNWYNYAGADPVNKTDPSGLEYSDRYSWGSICGGGNACIGNRDFGNNNGFIGNTADNREKSDDIIVNHPRLGAVRVDTNLMGATSYGAQLGWNLPTVNATPATGDAPQGGQQPKDDCVKRGPSGQCQYRRNAKGGLELDPGYAEQACKAYHAMMQSNKEVAAAAGATNLPGLVNVSTGGASSILGRLSSFFSQPGFVFMRGVSYLTTGALSFGSTPPPGCK